MGERDERDEFDRLLKALSPDREEAGKKYVWLRNRLSSYFEVRGQGQRKEDLTDDVHSKVARKLPEQQIPNLLAYCFGVARMVSRETLRASLRFDDAGLEIRDAGLDQPSPELAIEPTKQEIQLEALHAALAALPETDRTLVLDFYSSLDRRRLAGQFDVTPEALRVRVARLRKKLELAVEARIREHSDSRESK